MNTKTKPNPHQHQHQIKTKTPISNTITIIIYFIIRITLEFKLNSNSSNLFHSIIHRPELVTPITSWKDLQEGVYLFKNGYDPYQGDCFHQSPLLLYLFSIITNPFSISLIYSFLDCTCAWLSLKLFKLKFKTNLINKPKDQFDWILNSIQTIKDWQFLICYLFFPFQFLTSLSKSTILFTNLFILISLRSSLKNQLVLTMFSLSIATHLSVYPILLLPSAISIICEKRHGLSSQWSTQFKTIFQSILIYLIHFSTLLLLFPFKISQSVFLSQLDVNKHLNPNLGLHWYFSIEIFDHFRLFFNLIFQIHLLIYILPFLIKFKNERVFGLILMCGIISIFKSYPSIGDVSFAITLLIINYPELISRLRHPILTITLFLYSLSLLPTFYYQWIYLGSGNVNFYYASSLIWSISNGLFWIDMISTFFKSQFQMDLKNLKSIEGQDDWVLNEEIEEIVQS
ncbi:GPI transamidase subunit PIG-U [Melampsora americana]|nr:GPI transamidase subunit PIG-U [Melampsora americana]